MKRSLLLDALRIFAITLVFLAHFGQILNWDAGNFFGVKNFYYVSFGGLGVSLFLVLSGILAGLGESGKKSGYFSYMLKKVLRIYPLYWLSVPIAMLGYMLGEWVLDGNFPKLFPNGFGADLVGSLTGFYTWMGLWGGPYNSPSWFIGLIMVMYALFPLLYIAIKKQPHIAILILLGISVGSRIYVGKHGVPFVDQSFIEGVVSFFYRQYGFMPGRPGDWFPPCRVFEFGLGVYLALLVPKQFWFRLDIGKNKVITFLSDHAFALFLVHYPFLFLVTYLVEMGSPAWLAILVFMVFVVVVSYFITQLDSRFPRKRVIAMVGFQEKSFVAS